MQGNWVAECSLCKFSERYLEQDDALKAATLHAMKEHTEQQASLVSGKWITHVQNRAVDALGYEVPKASQDVQPSQQLTTDGANTESPAMSEQSPEGV